MAGITFPDDGSWIVARWAFEMLLNRAQDELINAPELQAKLDSAKAVDGLHLALLAESERRAISRAVARAARNLAIELEAKPQDKLGRSFIEALRQLNGRLGSPP